MPRSRPPRRSLEFSNARCPHCDAAIPQDQINITEGLAQCSACGALTQLSQLNLCERSIEEILAKPPSLCSMQADGSHVVIQASLRSWGGVLGLAAMSVFWNGIISIFVTIALAGLYANLIGPIPNGFPVPGGIQQGKPVMNDKPMELGETLFLCLFLVPFVAVGTGMLLGLVTYAFGKIVAVIGPEEAAVSTGVFGLKWTNRFDPNEVRAVLFERSHMESNTTTGKLIEIQADRTVRFGSMLGDDRLQWLHAALKKVLMPESVQGNGTAAVLP